MLEFDPILIKLARMSPPAYADTIRERNKELLGRLALLQALQCAHPGKSWDDIVVADATAHETMEDACDIVYVGCPHCHSIGRCTMCLWVWAGAERTSSGMPCANVRFPHKCTLMDMCKYASMSVGVEYGDADAEIKVYRRGCPVDASDLTSVRDYLQDHVDWADLDIWGADYADPGIGAAKTSPDPLF